MVLEVLIIESRELMVVNVGLHSLILDEVSVLIYLGDLRQSYLIQLLKVLFRFVIVLH